MAIRDETAATNVLLRDARFHRAALLSDRQTLHLAPAVQEVAAELKKRRNAHEDKEELSIDAFALLLRTDFDLDDKLRLLELDVLAKVNKNRQAIEYREVLRIGLSALVALRGEEEAREVRALRVPLKKHFPALDKTYGPEIERLCKATGAAEEAWKQSETVAVRAFGEERTGRAQVVRQLQKNEGALGTIYPGQKRRVRSFFRSTKRKGEGKKRPETPPES